MDFPFQEPSKAFEDTQRASCGCAALSERQRVFAEQSLTGARKYPENEACSCKRNPSPIYNPTIFSHYSITAFGSVRPAPDTFRSHIHSFCVYVAAGSRCSL